MSQGGFRAIVSGQVMRCSVTYYDRRSDGSPEIGCVLLADDWDISVVPCVGQYVILPTGLLKVLREKVSLPGIMEIAIRFEVVTVEHRWDTMSQTVVIGLAELHLSWKARTK